MNRTCGWDGLAFCPAAWGGFSSVACVVLFLDGRRVLGSGAASGPLRSPRGGWGRARCVRSALYLEARGDTVFVAALFLKQKAAGFGSGLITAPAEALLPLPGTHMNG